MSVIKNTYDVTTSQLVSAERSSVLLGCLLANVSTTSSKSTYFHNVHASLPTMIIGLLPY